MADIKQAVIWMREGKRASRPLWRNTTLGLRTDGIDHAERLWLFFRTTNENIPTEYVAYAGDFLADDWEIAE